MSRSSRATRASGNRSRTIASTRSVPVPSRSIRGELHEGQCTGTAVCNDKFSVPFPGKWVVVIRALRNEFDEVAVQTTVDIR